MQHQFLAYVLSIAVKLMIIALLFDYPLDIPSSYGLWKISWLMQQGICIYLSDLLHRQQLSTIPQTIQITINNFTIHLLPYFLVSTQSFITVRNSKHQYYWNFLSYLAYPLHLHTKCFLPLTLSDLVRFSKFFFSLKTCENCLEKFASSKTMNKKTVSYQDPLYLVFH